MITVRLPNGCSYTYNDTDGYDILNNTYYLYQKNPDRKVIAIVNINSGVIIETESPNITLNVNTVDAKSFGQYLQDNKNSLVLILKELIKDNVMNFHKDGIN